MTTPASTAAAALAASLLIGGTHAAQADDTVHYRHEQVGDVKVFYREAGNPSAPTVLLLHGFGASVFSWSRVMRPLARIAGAKVLAFDRPAFGLTSRASWSGDDSKPLNPYSMAFSVMATLAFIDYLGAEKAVLVGY